MPIEEAAEFFEAIPAIHRHLKTLVDVGLGYVRLGQPAPTLSGGEAQRVKLARELQKRSTGRTVYVLDEPTTGLHFEDIRKLLLVLEGPGRQGQHGHRHRAQPRRDQDRRLADRHGPGGRPQGRHGRRRAARRRRSPRSPESHTGQFLRPRPRPGRNARPAAPAAAGASAPRGQGRRRRRTTAEPRAAKAKAAVDAEPTRTGRRQGAADGAPRQRRTQAPPAAKAAAATAGRGRRRDRAGSPRRRDGTEPRTTRCGHDATRPTRDRARRPRRLPSTSCAAAASPVGAGCRSAWLRRRGTDAPGAAGPLGRGVDRPRAGGPRRSRRPPVLRRPRSRRAPAPAQFRRPRPCGVGHARTRLPTDVAASAARGPVGHDQPMCPSWPVTRPADADGGARVAGAA